MEINYNKWSFAACLFILVLSFQSLYASYNHSWTVAPPALVLWVLTVITFVLGIRGFGDKSSRGARWRSWLTVLISFSLSAIFLLAVAVNTFARVPIETTHSPDSNITIDFYTLNGGAATSISVVGFVNGLLWFKKRIYYDNNMHKADVEWINNHIVTINEHTMDLNKGETYSD